MKIKKEYIILILIIAALSGYLYLKNTDRLHYELPEAEQIDTDKITRMEILSKDKSISLLKKDETWHIQPEDYPVERKKADAMLAVLKDLTVTDMVSESGNYVIYELDDEGRITVKAYAGNSPVREFDIGKTAATYKHTYIRLAGDDRVYQAKGSFRKDFDHSVSDLRDKRVLSFNKGDVRSVTITDEDRSATLTREDVPKEHSQEDASQKAAMDIQWKDREGMVVEKEKVDRLLNRLSTLNCKEYLEGRTKAGLGKPEKEIVLTGTGEHSLCLYAKEGDITPATSSLNAFVFSLTAGNLEDIEKSLAELTGIPDEK